MTYETVASAVQQGGAVYFALLFAAVLVYAFWPKNREKFEKAARAALDAEE
ncbi:MAG: cbb3-type cytochrome c oxidase subunit 3 [Caulobacteraceae bacterium]|nr:cbb3-type cytochrome c oxidase subunit 3 [Caulobacteraceae bacterium]